ncbi:MAG: FkbM family methyltransferase, partial [Planctomycetales bacterium]|nr:FkbM family methyltransferase [Planctomycetales bacterium]
MKLRSFFHLLGLKPKSREYDTRLESFHLPQDGVVEYAQWLHPKDTPKQIRQQAVDSLREFINPGDVALDIGAHSGDSTLPMALAAGRTGRVFAFEPNPYVFRVLQQNAGLNQDKTHIVPYAFAAT